MAEGFSPRQSLLNKVISQVGRLEIYEDVEVECMHELTGDLLELHMPSLYHLRIESDAPQVDDGLPLWIKSTNMPVLRVLTLMNVNAIILTPLTSLTNFTYTPCSPELWQLWSTRLVRLPNIQHISLSPHDIFYTMRGEQRPIILSSLVSLELRQLGGAVEDVQQFLDFASLPNLRSLTLVRPAKHCYGDVLPCLVSPLQPICSFHS